MTLTQTPGHLTCPHCGTSVPVSFDYLEKYAGYDQRCSTCGKDYPTPSVEDVPVPADTPLYVDAHTVFPPNCVKCNAPAARSTEMFVARHIPLWLLAVPVVVVGVSFVLNDFALFPVFILLYAMATRQLRIRLPLCAAHRRMFILFRVAYSTVLGLGVALYMGSIVFVLFGHYGASHDDDQFLMGILPLALLLVALILRVIAGRVLFRADSIVGGRAGVMGACSEFLTMRKRERRQTKVAAT